MSVPTEYVKEKFPERFPNTGQPKVFRAPGRVNLIGEHTDYNQGFVMPIAIDLACFTAVASPGGDTERLRVYSEDLLQGGEWLVNEIGEERPRKAWVDYVLGVAQQLTRAGHPPKSSDLLIHSTVPVGSGLSSSAALEVSTALALGAGDLDRMELARLCQRAENEFVGMPCGIMDQYVSLFGRENAAILIDCRSLEHKAVPLPTNVAIIAVNTMVKHELGSSAYRQRVAECTHAVQYVQVKNPKVASLRDATLDMIDPSMGDVVYRRARHVISEDNRCLEFAAAAEASDLRRMGELFVASHRSLQNDYEVSCPELDFMVDTAIRMPGVYGARMTGGGFGGCTVNLVDPGAVESFERDLADAYREEYGIEPKIFECKPSAGAGPVS